MTLRTGRGSKQPSSIGRVVYNSGAQRVLNMFMPQYIMAVAVTVFVTISSFQKFIALTDLLTRQLIVGERRLSRCDSACEGQSEGQPGAAVRGLGPDSSAMRLDDSLGDIESQTRPDSGSLAGPSSSARTHAGVGRRQCRGPCRRP